MYRNSQVAACWWQVWDRHKQACHSSTRIQMVLDWLLHHMKALCIRLDWLQCATVALGWTLAQLFLFFVLLKSLNSLDIKMPFYIHNQGHLHKSWIWKDSALTPTSFWASHLSCLLFMVSVIFKYKNLSFWPSLYTLLSMYHLEIREICISSS